MFIVFCTMTTNRAADALTPVTLLGLRRLSPWLLLVSLCWYTWRLARNAWLRKEWCDFLQQFMSGEQMQCAICAEEVPRTPWHVATMTCCGGKLCWACVQRHAESVVSDMRPEMRCPLLPCRSCLPDVIVLAAFRRQQWSLQGFDPIGSVFRRRRRAYERWVLACGLAESCSARMEDVVHCPREDCEHMWVLPRESRARKDAAEPTTRWNPQSWTLTRCVGLYSPAVEDGHDARHLHCPCCGRDSCLLCGFPWGEPSKASSHSGKSCIEHSSAYPERQHHRTKWAGAKPCPGCGVRILRSWGCNKMTCNQCGSHWCWVCLSEWEPAHYGCSRAEWRDDADNEDSNCLIL
uniref:RBR-type E3 ubiquitin transferase n=1 Tax=Alexandrium catenella TaxID=2925 RepID=A0A7S1QEG8_ALECA|mmetsp:Transcript_27084/g.73495  ORF Transcript_27084/g.73495 Transcript_27084/m.73495 type:complete len:349 (+) Transcript_27084:2-1048(+)